jgi:hypothetical protein
MGLVKKCMSGKEKGNFLSIIQKEKSFEKESPWTLEGEKSFLGNEV